MRRIVGALRVGLLQPVDISSLAVFRIAFGALMCAAMVRSLALGWVRALYVEPSYHFTWPGLGFIRPWPGWGMYAHFAALALLAAGVAAGLCYRFCIVAFLLGFT